MNTTATFTNEFSVKHSIRPDVNREFISWDVPNGWDDVKKVTKKVVLFDGRRFVFSCWNSDRLEVVFVRGLDEEPKVAKFVK